MDLNTQAGFRSDVFTPDRLIADGAEDIVGKGITLVSGQNLSRGAVLGRITASGKYTLAAAASNDGSQNPAVILAQDCDASAADAQAVAYFQGTFNSAALTLGTGITAAAAADALRGLSIMIVDTIGGV
jgi:hypothetical protein